MGYSKANRRGILKKHQPRRKVVAPPRQLKQRPAVKHNGIYPYVARFLEWMQVRAYSQSTIDQREYGLMRWIHWCDERGLDDPKMITKPMLESYQKYLYYYRRDNGEPLSLSYQQSQVTGIKMLFKWLSRQNYILYNPASELELPKQRIKLPRETLTQAEMQRVLDLPDTTNLYGIRDKAILETLYSTGIRKGECVALGIYDIDITRQTLLVRTGKGGKERLLPLGKRAAYWIGCYVNEVRPELVVDPDVDHLFLTDYGEPYIKARLPTLVKRYLHHGKIEKTGACHLFRHAMATHMLENGADLRYVQTMLGHVDISSTQIYTQVNIKKLQAVHEATHPAKLDDVE